MAANAHSSATIAAIRRIHEYRGATSLMPGIQSRSGRHHQAAANAITAMKPQLSQRTLGRLAAKLGAQRLFGPARSASICVRSNPSRPIAVERFLERGHDDAGETVPSCPSGPPPRGGAAVGVRTTEA